MQDITGHEKIHISAETFNCHGFAQSSEYVMNRLNSCNILCLTETWIWPHEVNVISDTIRNHPTTKNSSQEYTVISKCGMNDRAQDYSGRGYGGVAVIVKNNASFSVKEIITASDRIAAAGIYDRYERLVQVVCSAYLPYFDGDKTRLAQYIETIDALQSLIDKYASLAPFKILGDFNTQLPISKKLNKFWYKEKGFTLYSSVLYDFLIHNNLTSADLHFKQNPRYTFFCHTSQKYTWIDHVICNTKDMHLVNKCNIIHEEPENVSDHLPVRIEFTLLLDAIHEQKINAGYIAQPKWSNAQKNDKYLQITTSKLSQMEKFSIPNTGTENLKEIFNNRFEEINNILTDAASEAGCIPHKTLKPKAYWCPELSALRDKKRIWWSIWVGCNKPRSGIVFDILKDLKKKFRQLCRKNINAISRKPIDTLNSHFDNKDMCAFWNKLKSNNHSKISSKLIPKDFENHYRHTMTDNGDLTEDQEQTSQYVKTRASKLSCICTDKVYTHYKKDCTSCGYKGHASDISNTDLTISESSIRSAIKSLKKSPSSGCDGISVNHMFYALSDPLIKALCELYSAMIATSIIPDIFEVGIIIPILKKATLCSNDPSNYRPITLSSVHSKIVELSLIPEDTAAETQFGFRKGRGTSTAVSLAHDVVKYMNNHGSSVYVCSLDAQKCFDSIWHDGLFHKLIGKIPDLHWIFLYKWYKSSKAKVRWEGELSEIFSISKGMRQGSILSPRLFSIFINDLLLQLQSNENGVRLYNFKLNAIAYADDINLFSTTATGLQKLIDTCNSYAKKWRIKFNPAKTKCIQIGKSTLKTPPTWTLDGETVKLSDETTILGVNFMNDMRAESHIKNRIRACNQSVFKFTTSGALYPGLNCKVKTHLWNTINCPVLSYGLETIHISNADLEELKTTQGTVIKRGLGLNKRSHYHRVLKACNITPIEKIISNNAARLYHNIFQCNTPARTFQSLLLSSYIITGRAETGTLLDRVVRAGYKPLNLILKKPKIAQNTMNEDGLVDSLKDLLHHENYQKPWSQEHMLANLLTKAF